ncbi:TPA: helix-turn-helix transcriptional regulator [Mannheimia haemolytica]|nr:AlpA family phage regulatory protein [Mannheimia haemolytica]
MKLLDTNEVCDLLGISRSTLYRWCNMSEDSSSPNNFHKLLMQAHQNSMSSLEKFGYSNDDESITDFPRPFKIGRALKWRDDEIMQWLEGKRI